MKAYTDIEQIKKLAEILPIESADMWVHPYWDDVPNIGTPDLECNQFPCWSLAALYALLPERTDISKAYSDDCVTMVYWCWNSAFDIETKEYDNPVDACFEMIVKLHKMNLL